MVAHHNSRPYSYREGVEEIGELLDKIGVRNFYVVGHSHGATWSLQIAAGLGGKDGRVLGAAHISRVTFTTQQHPKKARRSSKRS
jgi:pimeloyl-ACP methyl ester carboxylesterase